MTVTKLDMDRFRKVRALMTGGSTEGERAAAKARATEMARKAGMTLLDALSKLDTAPEATPANIFEGFDDWMEEKQPGYKAQKARERAEREDRYAARRAEILKEFGTVRAFLDATPLELLLLKAGKPFVTKRSSYEDVCGTTRQCAAEFAGARGHHFEVKNIDPRAVDAIRSAYLFPTSICGAFEELKQWDKLERDRAHFYDHQEYYFDLPIELRIELLREVMRHQPVTSWADMDARFHYKSYSWQQQWIDERAFEDAEWSRLFGDVQILRNLNLHNGGGGVQDGQADAHAGVAQSTAKRSGQPNVTTYGDNRRTNAAIRKAVLSMLDSHPELSDREISRRVGVSPQTVSNWRKRLASNPTRAAA